MSDAPTIKGGERTEVKAGLYQILLDAGDKKKLIAFWNSSKDLQFQLIYQFQANEGDIELCGDTQKNGDKYALTLYPGETKEMVKGTWKASKRSFSYGAPDQAWQEKKAAEMNQGVDQELQAVKQALKAHPKEDGKYTAEYIAAVCEKTNTPFVDITFPPKGTSCCREFEGTPPVYAWMRPTAYCTDPSKPPCLFVGEIEPNDIDQGQLGNCYFLCALACISEFPNIIKDMFHFPQRPELGIYRTRLCKNGWWQVVTLDDLLPTVRNLPIYAKNREEPNELWVSMLEKAYAKVHGSYAAIRAGDPAQALGDMVGGPYLKLKDHPDYEDKEKLFSFLQQCDDDDHLMCLGTPGVDTSSYNDKGGESKPASGADLAERYKEVGLVTGHAFSLIRVKEYKGLKLCMIRNPWGNGMEWNGDWSDDDKKWTPEMKKALEFYDGDDGTFWMAWADVCKWFETGCVCFYFPDWTRLRVAANLDASGCPDLVLKITVSQSAVETWIGAHQRDNRGLPTGDKDRNYLAFLVAILQEDDKGRMKTCFASFKGAFCPARDAYANGVLQPSEKPYYVLAQAYQNQTKSFVLSCFLQHDKGVAVQFVTFKEGTAKKFNPPSQFKSADCQQKAAANYQLITPRTKPEFLELQGDSVNMQAVPTAKPKLVSAAPAKGPAAKPAAKGHVDPNAAVAPPAKSPVASQAATASATAAPASSGGGKLKVSVTVIAGRNLISRDVGGASDPYVTIKIFGKDGNPVPGVEKQKTKYIANTLNPTWGEQFTFPVGEDEEFRLFCWDKDTFGKDPMGDVTIPFKSLGIKPGGPAKMDYFPLQNTGTGELQLLFVCV